MISDSVPVSWGGELSPLEHAMYKADGDQRSRTTFMAVELLDILPDWDRLLAEVDRASRVVPGLRQKVGTPLFPVTGARWTVDADFDLTYHVRSIRLRHPGGVRELLDFASAEFLTPLDRGRPLWSMTMLDGLNEGDAKAALVWKLSGVISSGAGGLVLDKVLSRDDRNTDLGPLPPLPAPEEISPVAMTRRAVHRLPLTLSRSAVRGARRTVEGARRLASDPAAAQRAVGTTVGVLGDLLGGGGPDSSPLLAGRGAKRQFEALEFPLEDLRGAATAHGCSTNDAFVTGICGALRRFHEALGVPVDELPLGIGINGQPADGLASLGDQWSVATISAPLAIADPVERMKVVHREFITAPTGTVDLLRRLAPLLAWVPSPALAGLGSETSRIDVGAISVTGHAGPRFLAGAEVLRSVPFAPTAGAAMMISMRPLNGTCNVGVNCDASAVGDGATLLECLHAGFQEVFAAGTTRDSPGDARVGDRS